MLDVWYALSPIDVAPVLSRDERQRRDQFVDAAARQRYERAHGLKRVVLAHYAAGCAPQDLRFTRGRCGKPEADQPFPYRFNMSHSAHCIAIAVAADDVGVDIEWHRPIVASASLARCVFHDEERRWLARQACFDEAFFRLWTLKEALLKAAGTGFSRPAQQACWEDLDESQARASYVGRRWLGRCERFGHATLAVAVSADCPIGATRLLRVDGASDVSPSFSEGCSLRWSETPWMTGQPHFQRNGTR